MLSSKVQRKDNPLRSRNVKLQLPLLSERVNVQHDHYLLGINSQRQIRRCIESQLVCKYHRVENLMRMQLLKLLFDRWNHYQPGRRPVTARYYYPTLITYDIPYRAILTTGLRTLFIYLYHECKRRVHKAFVWWKEQCSQERRLLRRLYDKWSIKASLLKLNRLNGIRYLKLMRRFARKVCLVRTATAFACWRKSTELRHCLVLVRLLFRCWKLSSLAAKRLRIAYLRIGLGALRDCRLFWKEYRPQLLRRVTIVLVTRALRRSLRRWERLCRKKLVLRKILLSAMDRSLLLTGFNTWKLLLLSPQKLRVSIQSFVPTPGKSSEPTLPSTPKSLTVSPKKQHFPRDVLDSKRKGRTCSSPFCSHADLFCGSVGSTPCKYASHTLHVSANTAKTMTPQQKARMRMDILKTMNDEYTKRESFRSSTSKSNDCFWN
jgi:hypothetical protein